MSKTSISWATESWNPFVGCSLVSPACTNCYAMHQAARMLRMSAGKPSPYDGTVKTVNGKPVWTGALNQASETTRFAPLKWARARTVFVGSMTDFFHPAAGDAWRIEALAIMALTPRHTYLILTKRSADMRRLMADPATQKAVWTKASEISIQRNIKPAQLESVSPGRWPLPNVALGVSAEDQTRADERIPYLLETPAAQRFVSCEPLLGAIDLTSIDINGDAEMDSLHPHSWREIWDNFWSPEATGVPLNEAIEGYCEEGGVYPPTDERGASLDFVITGGGNDLDGRPTHPDWLRSLRDQCAAANVKFHFKQWGAWIDGDQWLLAIRDTGADFVDIEDGKITRRIRSPLNFHDAAALGTASGVREENIHHQSDGATFFRIGTARSGRTLDGREHLDVLGETQ